MTALKAPLLVLVTSKNGRKRLIVETRTGDSISTSLRRVFTRELSSFELIDAAGNYFPAARGKLVGVDWKTESMGGMLMPLTLPIRALLLGLRVRLEIDPGPQHTLLSLDEIRTKVIDAIMANPRIYTWAPPQEIAGRLRRARSVESLINSIYKD